MGKINIAELLKDCPKGMELDCLVWDNIVFEEIDGDSIVIFRTSVGAKVYLTQYGEVNSIDGNCVIFPKGKTTWEGFHWAFRDGDVIYNRLQKKICIYFLCIDEVPRIKGCRYNESNIQFQFEKLEYPIPIATQDYRLATEEEKQKLFDAIKANGYKWNTETKTLEKLVEPKFKVRDRIKNKKDHISGIIANIYEDGSYKVVYQEGGVSYVSIAHQDDWELAPNKFDITTLKPFESKVLVRNVDGDLWKPAIYGFSSSKRGCYVMGGVFWKQCIPYEAHKELLGTTNDCDEYFKIWE